MCLFWILSNKLDLNQETRFAINATLSMPGQMIMVKIAGLKYVSLLQQNANNSIKTFRDIVVAKVSLDQA